MGEIIKKIKKVIKAIENLFLKILSAVLNFALKPLADSTSTEQYNKRGYWYGFVFLLLIGAFFFLSEFFGLSLGFLTYKLGDFPQEMKNGIQNYLQESGYNRIKLPSYISIFPIYFLIPVIYLSVNIIPSMRIFSFIPTNEKIGELFMKYFLIFFVGIVDIGEWFIKRRWLAIGTIFCLSVLITAGIYYLNNQSSRRTEIKKDLKAWFDLTEMFVIRDTLTGNRKEEYENRIKINWNQEIEDFLRIKTKNDSPFIILNNLLTEIHGKNVTGKSWFSHLNSIDLLKSANAIKSWNDNNSRKEQNSDYEREQRVNSLIYLYIGGIFNRQFENDLTTSTSVKNITPEKLKKLGLANESFDNAEKIIKKIAVTEANRKWTRNYQSAINNGRGNLYSNYFRYLVKKRAENDISQIDDNLNECQYLRDCAWVSEKYFIASTKDFGDCSYQSIRMKNNVADLYMKIAHYYLDYSNSKSIGDKKNEITDVELAKRIDEKINEIQGCLGEEGAPNAILIYTLAQTLASSTKLKIENAKEKEGTIKTEKTDPKNLNKEKDNVKDSSAENSDLINSISISANNLKIAYNLDRPGLKDLDFSPFCYLINQPMVMSGFSDEKKQLYLPYQEIFIKSLKKKNPNDLDSPLDEILKEDFLREACQSKP